MEQNCEAAPKAHSLAITIAFWSSRSSTASKFMVMNLAQQTDIYLNLHEVSKCLLLYRLKKLKDGQLCK